MEFKVDKSAKTKDKAYVSMRLDKDVWDLLEAAVAKSAAQDSETKPISRQKMVELILGQVLRDNTFKLNIPPDLAKPKKSKKGSRG